MSVEGRSSGRGEGWMALGVVAGAITIVGLAGNYVQNIFQEEAAQFEQDIHKNLKGQLPGVASLDAHVSATDTFWNGDLPGQMDVEVGIVPSEGDCTLLISGDEPSDDRPQIQLFYGEIEGVPANTWSVVTDMHLETRYVLPNGELSEEIPEDLPELAGEPSEILVGVGRLVTLQELRDVADAYCESPSAVVTN